MLYTHLGQARCQRAGSQGQGVGVHGFHALGCDGGMPLGASCAIHSFRVGAGPTRRFADSRAFENTRPSSDVQRHTGDTGSTASGHVDDSVRRYHPILHSSGSLRSRRPGQTDQDHVHGPTSSSQLHEETKDEGQGSGAFQVLGGYGSSIQSRSSQRSDARSHGDPGSQMHDWTSAERPSGASSSEAPEGPAAPVRIRSELHTCEYYKKTPLRFAATSEDLRIKASKLSLAASGDTCEPEIEQKGPCIENLEVQPASKKRDLRAKSFSTKPRLFQLRSGAASAVHGSPRSSDLLTLLTVLTMLTL